MKKKLVTAFLLLTLAVVVTLAGVWAFRRFSPRQADVKMFSELRDLHQIVLAEMSVNKVGVISDDGLSGLSSLISSFKLGERIAVYSYDTFLEAYIDLDGLTPGDVEIDEAHKVVKLRLPAVQTRFAGRDMEVKEEHYRVTMLRSHISPSERAALKERMNTSLKAEVENNTEYRRMVTEQARTKAVGFFTALLRGRGYDAEVTVAP